MPQVREQQYYDEVRESNRAVWNGIHKLLALQSEWNANQYGTTLDDGTDANLGLVGADLGAVVFDAANALKTTLETGIASSMAKLL